MKYSALDPNVVPTTMGERIRAMRTAWGWSQNMLADAIRVDQASVSFWERDRIRPSGTAILALSALFRVSPETLETGQGFVIPDPPTPRPQIDSWSPRSVSLPMIPVSGTMTVNVMDGTAKNANLDGMIVDLAGAVQEGRRVWVVVE